LKSRLCHWQCVAGGRDSDDSESDGPAGPAAARGVVPLPVALTVPVTLTPSRRNQAGQPEPVRTWLHCHCSGSVTGSDSETDAHTVSGSLALAGSLAGSKAAAPALPANLRQCHLLCQMPVPQGGGAGIASDCDSISLVKAAARARPSYYGDRRTQAVSHELTVALSGSQLSASHSATLRV
jgi:hypothetical protein